MSTPGNNGPNEFGEARTQSVDVFLGTFHQDCSPGLTDEQRKWPVVEARSVDQWLGSFDDAGRRVDDCERLILNVRKEFYPEVLANIREIISGGPPRERVVAAAEKLARLGAGITIEPNGR